MTEVRNRNLGIYEIREETTMKDRWQDFRDRMLNWKDDWHEIPRAKRRLVICMAAACLGVMGMLTFALIGALFP